MQVCIHRDQRLCQLLVFVLYLSVSGTVFGADDDYLKALEAESSKLEPGKLDAGQGEQNEVAGQQMDSDIEMSDVRVKFEQILSEKYHGSYTFYSKLPERSRQEIVKDYQQGKPFVQIRKIIIDRFMQR